MIKMTFEELKKLAYQTEVAQRKYTDTTLSGECSEEIRSEMIELSLKFEAGCKRYFLDDNDWQQLNSNIQGNS